ncbi:Stress protein DDR48 [Hondaea fermentalgiana]|uniref:Stress protein DDR48 n=1 Tax=Hondaea fermentalgiana TaxID=2315210 RepID=A0A2R5G074_9STRA|nr:Stress protein DDR48 [Hondaea fermentalgiana]|eukprot:GBG24400.1 Stress protein DDR48 [Hondaea fermentalgiana]
MAGASRVLAALAGALVLSYTKAECSNSVSQDACAEGCEYSDEFYGDINRDECYGDTNRDECYGDTNRDERYGGANRDECYGYTNRRRY